MHYPEHLLVDAVCKAFLDKLVEKGYITDPIEFKTTRE